MQRTASAMVHGLELRRTEARLVARNGAVLGIVAPAHPQAATGWRWWTHQGSGMALCCRPRSRGSSPPATRPDDADDDVLLEVRGRRPAPCVARGRTTVLSLLSSTSAVAPTKRG